MAKRTHFGTGIRRELDIASIRRSLTGEIDSRTWFTYATVCAFDGETGEPDFTKIGLYISPEGIDVDALTSPGGDPITCRYAGIQGGSSVAGFAPIHPGDEIVVGLPGGQHGSVPIIIAIMNGAHTPIPLEADGTPVFKNDRLSIFAVDVPIEIRTAGKGHLRINQDATIQMGGTSAAEQLVLGTTQRSAEATLNDTTPTGLQGIWTAAATACVGPLAALNPFFTAAALAIQTYEAQSSGFLSNVAKTQKDVG